MTTQTHKASSKRVAAGEYLVTCNGRTYEVERRELATDWNVFVPAVGEYGEIGWTEREWCQTFDTKAECLEWIGVWG